MRIQLQLLNGEKIDRSLDLDSFIIGRSAKCEVVVPHEGMSRQHCQIEVVNGEVFITDLGSTNGVLIDGVRIEPHKKTPYATYLTLAFGAVQSMQIQLTEPTNTIQIPQSLPKKETKDPAASGNATTMTKTKSMNEPSKTSGNIPRPKKPESKLNIKNVMINILCLGILGGAIWWFMENKDAPEATDEGNGEEYVEGNQ